MTRALIHDLRSAIRALVAARGRVGFTLLALAVGAMTVGLVATLSASAAATLTSGIDALGGRGLAVVMPRADGARIPRWHHGGLQSADERALRRALGPGVWVESVVSERDQHMGTNSTATTVTVDVGVGASHRALLFRHMLAGRDLVEERFDDDAIVLSAAVAERLYGLAARALDKQVWVWGHGYRVVGVTGPKAHVALRVTPVRKDRAVFVTRGGYERREGGRAQAYLLLRHGADIDHAELMRKVRRELSFLHRREGDVELMDVAAVVATFETLIRAVGAVLVMAGGVAVLVAGTGVMNVMLASVSERRRELGLLRALGVSRRRLARQLKLEAMILGAAAGLAGTLLGAGLGLGAGAAIERVTGNFARQVPPGLMLLGTVGTAAVALAFGVYPARLAGARSVRAAMLGDG